MILFQIDINGFFTGSTKDVPDTTPFNPRQWVMKPPPAAAGGKFPFWNGVEWHLADEYQYVAPAIKPKLPPMTHLQFIRRFTHAEAAAFETLLADCRNGTVQLPSEQRGQVLLMGRMFDAAQDVLLDDPDTVAFVASLEALGIVTDERRQQILNPRWQPSQME